MRLMDIWLERDQWLAGESKQVRIVSRIINVSDVQEAAFELRGVCDRVETRRVTNGEHDIGMGQTELLVEPLETASDAVLRSFEVNGYLDGCEWPTVQIILGRDRPGQILMSPRVEEAKPDLDPDVKQQLKQAIDEAARRAWQVLTRAGRRRLGPRQWTDIIQLLAFLALAGLFIWFAVSVGSLPVSLVGLLAVVSGYLSLRSALTRTIEKHVAAHPWQVIVRPITREDWRQERWARKRDFKVAITTVVATFVATAVAAIAVSERLPSWLNP